MYKKILVFYIVCTTCILIQWKQIVINWCLLYSSNKFVMWHNRVGEISCSSHIYLLSTRNQMLLRFHAQLIQRITHFLDSPFKKICLCYVDKFLSQSFNKYYLIIRIDIEHHVAYNLTHYCHQFNKLLQVFPFAIDYW
ncbi:hypothetical protein CR513_22426, partial [Mucuna pruriens]